jgi:N-acyl-D-aspartate/D-glutamate deacylase
MPDAPDLVIRNGLVVDGTGAEPFPADVAVTRATITAVGRIGARGRDEIDATHCIVTPGFIDTHSHLDGNVTWENRLKPNSGHGVTTTIMGNCGVGFAPCRESDREFTVALMEGVEDIPARVLWAGLPWAWQSYPEYRAFLATRRFDMHVGGLLPHSCLRVFVMGERAIRGEPATTDDIASMESLTYEALRAGASGVGSTRLTGQRTLSGTPAPSIAAREDELAGIARGIARAGRGVLQIAPEFNQFPRAEEELGMVVRVARATGCRVTYSLKQTNGQKDGWKRLLEITDGANRDGLDLRPMVFGRPTGAIFGWECSLHRFVHAPAYLPLADFPLAARVGELRKPAVRDAILSETQRKEADQGGGFGDYYRLLFPIGELPDYEPRADDSVASLAQRAGVHPTEIIYDAMMRDDGRGALLLTSGNYADGHLEPSLAMMRFPRSVLGLADAGAHCTIICDASAPTTMLAYWARDRTRGERLTLPEVVRRLTSDAADLFDLRDRGIVRQGMKADLNVIDHARLQLRPPRMEYDLPTGGRRLVQDAVGYVATLVDGVPVRRNDAPTDALPGKLVGS